MINKKMTINTLKNYIFDMWETQYFLTINGICFDTEKMTLAYDPEFNNFEMYSINDTDSEKVLCSLGIKRIKTVDNILILLDEWL